MSTLRTEVGRPVAKPEVQEQAATQRTDQDQVAEVVRGYELGSRLLAVAAARRPASVEPVLLQGTLAFDLAEFLYGQKADLKTYTSIRDQAFVAYRRAAAGTPLRSRRFRRGWQSVNVYRQWFQVGLGGQRPGLPDAGRTAPTSTRSIAWRPPCAASAARRPRHLTMFGQGVVESISEIPPHFKPHYLRQAGRVLAGQPAGEPVRQRLKFYDDLLGEVQLNIAVNGNAAVGHNRPFGGQLSIRCTAALGARAGASRNLLQKNWSQTSNREIDYPKDIEQAVREKLSQAFNVEIVRFHDPKVAPRGFGRLGWRETPLAYLVLRQDAVGRSHSERLDRPGIQRRGGHGALAGRVASRVDRRPRRPSPAGTAGRAQDSAGARRPPLGQGVGPTGSRGRGPRHPSDPRPAAGDRRRIAARVPHRAGAGPGPGAEVARYGRPAGSPGLRASLAVGPRAGRRPAGHPVRVSQGLRHGRGSDLPAR